VQAKEGSRHRVRRRCDDVHRLTRPALLYAIGARKDRGIVPELTDGRSPCGDG
jgi:hypothetical protein